MTERDAVDLLKNIESIGIMVWVGGGWGVDALVAKQTRPHNDIDIYTEKKNADAIISLLTSSDFHEVKMDYSTEAHTVWKNSAGACKRISVNENLP